MDAKEYKYKNIIVLELRGRVDELNATILSEEVETIWRTGKKNLVIDLTYAEHISSVCLKALWLKNKILRQSGGSIYFLGACGNVAETIAFVGLQNFIPCLSNIEEIVKLVSDVNKNNTFEPSDRPTNNNAKGFFQKFENFFKKISIFLFCFIAIYQTAVAEKEEFTLDEVIRISNESSGQITLARLRMAEREADVNIEKSEEKPHFFATGGYLMQSEPNILGDILNRELNGVRNSTSESASDQLNTKTQLKLDKEITLMSVGAWQLFYLGGLQKHKTALKQAKKVEAEAEFQAETISIEEKVRGTFFGLLLVQQKLEFLNAQKIAFDERMKAVLEAKEADALTDLQAAEAEALILKVKSEILSAEREERTLRGLLNLSLGRPLYKPLKPSDTPQTIPIKLKSVEHYVDIAIHRSSDVKKSVALIDSANAYQKIVEAQSTFSPVAGVYGGFDYVRGATTSKNATNWKLGVGVLIPLYDGGKSMAEFEKSRILQTQARIAFDEAENKLRADIIEIVSHIEQAKAQLALANKLMEIAEKRVEDTNLSVTQEVLPHFKAAEAVASKIEARLGVISAQADLYLWNSRLESIIGKNYDQ